MNTIDIVKESPWSHKGTAVIDGEHYTFDASDVNPYSVYDIYSVKQYPVKGRLIRLKARLQSTYLYDDDDLLLKHMTDSVRRYMDKLMTKKEEEE